MLTQALSLSLSSYKTHNKSPRYSNQVPPLSFHWEPFNSFTTARSHAIPLNQPIQVGFEVQRLLFTSLFRLSSHSKINAVFQVQEQRQRWPQCVLRTGRGVNLCVVQATASFHSDLVLCERSLTDRNFSRSPNTLNPQSQLPWAHRDSSCWATVFWSHLPTQQIDSICAFKALCYL